MAAGKPRIAVSIPGIFIVAIGVLSAILSRFTPFSRRIGAKLLSLSAENASIAVCCWAPP